MRHTKKIFLLLFVFVLTFFVGHVKETSAQEFIKVINVEDYGANGRDTLNDWKPIQKALNEVPKYGGGLVKIIIPDGNYYISDPEQTKPYPLKLYSNTYLELAPNAKMIRNSKYSPMIMNYSSKTAGGYTASHNITIDGGIWEGNMQKFPTPFDNILFGHSENVTVKNAKVLNNYGGHQIEFAGVKNGQALNNYIEGYMGEKKKEAIQIDNISQPDAFPPFGPYDNTPSVDILVSGNQIMNHSRGVGSHTAVAGIFHQNITIENNTFTNIKHEGIDAYNYNDLIVKNNIFTNVGLGIEYVPGAVPPPDGYRINISDNKINGTKTAEKTIGNGIIIEGKAQSPVSDVKIMNNEVSNCQNDGIYLKYTSASTVLNNVITGCKRNGVSVNYQSSENTISQNKVEKNEKDGLALFKLSSFNSITDNQMMGNKGNGIALNEDSNDNTLSTNSISASGKHGVILSNRSSATLTKNTILSSGQNGLSISDFSSGDLENNTVKNSKNHGISVYLSSSITAKNNRISNSSVNGISVSFFSSDNTLSYNTITNSHRHGISIYDSSSGNVINNNTIQKSGEYGIILNQNVTLNQVYENTLSAGSQKGNQTFDQLLIADYCSENTIEKNILKYNSYTKKARYGIHLTSLSSHNIVKLNNITKSGVTKDLFNKGKLNVISDNF